jgi:malonyl-CoA O-methyltransferase
MNPGIFDSRQLRRSFGRAARDYATVAVLQREVERRLLENLDYLDARAPQGVLDLGCGPGFASAAMKKRWPRSRVLALDLALPMLREARRRASFWRPFDRVCADACALPLAEASMDLVFSSLCLQWVGELPRALAEVRRVLRDGGLFVFSTFGPDTLAELREAYLESGEAQPPVSPFAAIQQVGDALVAAGFRDPVLDREHYTLTYRDVPTLLGELRAIGAGDARTTRPRGLAGKGRRQRMLAAYEAQRRDGLLPSTWEVITAMAWAPAAGAPRREGEAEIARFPGDRIPLRRR